MQKKISQSSNRYVNNAWLFFLALLVLLQACKKPSPGKLKNFTQVNLVANNDKYGAIRVDPNFINGWGIAFSPGGTAWVSAAFTGLSEVWDKAGNEVRPAVTIPSPGDAEKGGLPTGQVFNGTTDFKLPNGNPARFIFVGLDGIISGWNGGNAAVTALDNSKNNAVYTGIALAADGGANFLYIANFSAAKIDVYDKDWNKVNKAFLDPSLPAGYSPYNIQNIGGKLYVMYAKAGTSSPVEFGKGKGYVDIFKADGMLEKRFASGGNLNAPWGIAEAPPEFWGDDSEAKKTILVGNFGDGYINAYNEGGKLLGPLSKHGKSLKIEGLWGISFVPATATDANMDWLYFAAGPAGETDGLYGYIERYVKEE